jgi:GAG-pre-integrase domain
MATKRRREDDDDDVDKSNENFPGGSPDIQPITSRNSSPIPEIIANQSPTPPTPLPKRDSQPTCSLPAEITSSGRKVRRLSSPQATPTAPAPAPVPAPVQTVQNDSSDDFHLWHQRLGHTSYNTLRSLGLFPNLKRHVNSLQACEVCAYSKQTRLLYPQYEHKAQRRLWCVHSDMSGIQELSLIDGYIYFITLIDDYS